MAEEMYDDIIKIKDVYRFKQSRLVGCDKAEYEYYAINGDGTSVKVEGCEEGKNDYLMYEHFDQTKQSYVGLDMVTITQNWDDHIKHCNDELASIITGKLTNTFVNKMYTDFQQIQFLTQYQKCIKQAGYKDFTLSKKYSDVIKIIPDIILDLIINYYGSTYTKSITMHSLNFGTGERVYVTDEYIILINTRVDPYSTHENYSKHIHIPHKFYSKKIEINGKTYYIELLKRPTGDISNDITYNLISQLIMKNVIISNLPMEKVDPYDYSRYGEVKHLINYNVSLHYVIMFGNVLWIVNPNIDFNNNINNDNQKAQLLLLFTYLMLPTEYGGANICIDNADGDICNYLVILIQQLNTLNLTQNIGFNSDKIVGSISNITQFENYITKFLNEKHINYIKTTTVGGYMPMQVFAPSFVVFGKKQSKDVENIGAKLLVEKIKCFTKCDTVSKIPDLRKKAFIATVQTIQHKHYLIKTD